MRDYKKYEFFIEMKCKALKEEKCDKSDLQCHYTAKDLHKWIQLKEGKVLIKDEKS